MLQAMLPAAVQKRFPPIDRPDALQSVIAYAMTLSWPVRDALEEKGALPD